MRSADSELYAAAAAEAEPKPRSGVRIAVFTMTSRADDLRAPSGLSLAASVRRGNIIIHSVCLETPDMHPVFTAVRNPYEVTGEDDRTKQTAIDMARHADLIQLPPEIREPLEVYRRECEAKVDYGLRTYNIDAARVAGEKIGRWKMYDDIHHYLLTSDYFPNRKRH